MSKKSMYATLATFYALEVEVLENIQNLKEK